MPNPPETDTDGWVTASAAAAMLDVKRTTLYAYVSRGMLRSREVPGSRARRYHVGDLERLKARSDARRGHGPVAAGALRWGEPVLDSAITRISATRGPVYRGRAATALAATEAFEDVVGHLLQLDACVALSPPTLPWSGLARLLGPTPGVIPTMLTTLTVWSTRTPPLLARTAQGRAALASRLLPTLAGAAALALTGPEAAARAAVAPSIAHALCTGLGGAASRRRLTAIDAALVLAADHELNASAFAARVAASAGAQASACLGAALETLGGARHGGTTHRIEAWLADVNGPEHAPAAVEARARSGEPLAGFGHPLYPDGDPRTGPLLEHAMALGGRRRPVRTMHALADAVRLAGGQPPTIDFGLVALRHALGWPEGAALALFACGRAAGWLAHVLEQAESDVLLRPRARYVGPVEADLTPRA